MFRIKSKRLVATHLSRKYFPIRQLLKGNMAPGNAQRHMLTQGLRVYHEVSYPISNTCSLLSNSLAQEDGPTF